MATSQGDLQANPINSGPSWPELLGSDNWSGLLDPLDMTLRRLLLLCGDLCQVTYDSFNSDTHSAYCGSCRYGMKSILRRTYFPAANDMTVTHYLYATSEMTLPGSVMLFSRAPEAWSQSSNWIGYVAVSSDAAAAADGRRVIYMAWRGTIRTLEWVDVLKADHVEIDKILSTPHAGDKDKHRPKVMKGWYIMYTSSNAESPFSRLSARDQLMSAVKELVEKYKDENLSIVCAGHSLGASLATLAAFDIVENGLSKVGDSYIPVTAFVFGSPEVGNQAFKARFEKLPNLRVLRVKNKHDVIPLYPSWMLGYAKVGTEFDIDSKKSPFVNPDTRHVGDYHNLQGILHTVAGWNGWKAKFELRVERSIALVNKSSAYLKEECLVPASWWVEKNNGMVVGSDGQWQLLPPPGEDMPVPPFMALAKVVDKCIVDDDKTNGNHVVMPSRG